MLVSAGWLWCVSPVWEWWRPARLLSPGHAAANTNTAILDQIATVSTTSKQIPHKLDRPPQPPHSSLWSPSHWYYCSLAFQTPPVTHFGNYLCKYNWSRILLNCFARISISDSHSSWYPPAELYSGEKRCIAQCALYVIAVCALCRPQ